MHVCLSARQSVVLALLRICDHIGRESIFTGTLLSMLAPGRL